MNDLILESTLNGILFLEETTEFYEEAMQSNFDYLDVIIGSDM